MPDVCFKLLSIRIILRIHQSSAGKNHAPEKRRCTVYVHTILLQAFVFGSIMYGTKSTCTGRLWRMLSFQDAHICPLSIPWGAEHVKWPWEAIRTDLLTLPYVLEICHQTPEIGLPRVMLWEVWATSTACLLKELTCGVNKGYRTLLMMLQTPRNRTWRPS